MKQIGAQMDSAPQVSNNHCDYVPNDPVLTIYSKHIYTDVWQDLSVYGISINKILIFLLNNK
jgi:hypothetical protein